MKKEIKSKDLRIEDGKIIIENNEMLKDLKDQGMNFKDDGSLDLDEGQKLKFHFEI